MSEPEFKKFIDIDAKDFQVKLTREYLECPKCHHKITWLERHLAATKTDQKNDEYYCPKCYMELIDHHLPKMLKHAHEHEIKGFAEDE